MGPTYPSYLSNMTSKTYKVLLCLMDRRRSLIPIALLLSWFVASSAPAGAQTRHPMTLVELAELQRMFSPQLSPDGATLAYFLSNPNWKTNRLVFHMWRQPRSEERRVGKECRS